MRLRLCLWTAAALSAGVSPAWGRGDAPAAATSGPTSGPMILTPAPPREPRINGAWVFGVRPGRPFLFTVAATGDRPMSFSADGLPGGLKIDSETGRITGLAPTAARFQVLLHARNQRGVATRGLEIVVGDAIGLTPAMGWNSWNCWAGSVDQAKVLAAAKTMAQSSLLEHGWTYVNIDDTWQGERGGKWNAIQPDAQFPDMVGLCAAIHAMGLKVGIYSTPWMTSYAGHAGESADNPQGKWKASVPREQGQFHFAAADASQWAAWGIDYLKYDWNPITRGQVAEMRDALVGSGRDIIYSLSNDAPFEAGPDVAGLANSWRTTGDISDSWQSVRDIGFCQDRWSVYAGPGHFNDPDMLVVGSVGWGPVLHATHLTADEQYTHISLWCMLSAPLLLGCDLQRLDAFTMGLITNDDVLAVDQDPLAKQATCVARDGPVQIFTKKLADGATAVGFFNIGGGTATATARFGDLGLGRRQRVRDLWREKDVGRFSDSFTATVAEHGVVLVKVTPVR